MDVAVPPVRSGASIGSHRYKMNISVGEVIEIQTGRKQTLVGSYSYN